MAYTTINKGSDYFNTVLYTGDGSTNHPVTGVGFQPDLVWTKGRSGSYGVSNHKLVDVVRGAGQTLHSNLTDSEFDQSAPTGGSTISFDTDGFTLGSNTNSNASGTTFVAWNWLANNTSGSSNTDGSIASTISVNTTAGFSIVSFTGTGSAATVGHGLGKEVDCIAIKNRIDAAQWSFYHRSLGGTKYMAFNSTSAAATASTQWNNTDPTSSVFSVGTSNNTNDSGDGMIAYCFASIKGFSKFGSYTGNGSTDGTFVYTGFKPAFIMTKRTDSTSDWILFDSKRLGYNGDNKRLYPNQTSVEDTTGFDLLSNGFKSRSTAVAYNASGGTYIYMAFAENPLVTSTKLPATAR